MSSVDLAVWVGAEGLESSRAILAELDLPRGGAGARSPPPTGEPALALYLLKRFIPPPPESFVEAFADGGKRLEGAGGSRSAVEGGSSEGPGETAPLSLLATVSMLVPLFMLARELPEVS